MIEIIFISVALLLLISVLVSKISDRFGVPALLLFLLLGMLAGSDGPGGIYFDDPSLAQWVGVVALVIILFSGGLDTDWNSVRPVFKEGMVLATVGVLVTALVVGFFSSFLLKLTLAEGMLVGAIVSSTDAAAVFAVLRGKGIHLKGRLKPLLELESGSNDPMAVFLTIGMIQVLTHPGQSLASLLLLFVRQMGIGLVVGVAMGYAIRWLVNRARLGYDGLYSVLVLSLVFFTYGIAAILQGSGFLAVYLAGILLGRRDFIHKRSITQFSDGLAWLMQIAMFLTLGLLVFPTRLVPIIGVGLLIAACLIFLARPVSVALSLLPFRMDWRHKTFVAWVGLRGAVPIVLATFPLINQLPQADLIFNVVFFVVLTSVLLQGTTLPLMSRLLRVQDLPAPRRVYPIEYMPVSGFKSELKELPVPQGSPMTGKAIVEMGLPPEFLVVLLARENDFSLTSGATIVQEGDTMLVLADPKTFSEVQARFQPPAAEVGESAGKTTEYDI